MRIALLGEGTYPVVTGGVSTWCDHLFRGLPEHEFHVVTLVAGETTQVWEPPANVASITLHPFWGVPPARAKANRPAPGRRRRLRGALARLWSTLFPPGGRTDPDLGVPLRQLADLAHEAPLGDLLLEEGSAPHLLRAWRRYSRRHGLQDLAPADAAAAGRLADSMLRALDVEFPEVDVLHTSANGPSALMGLGRRWRDGTPLVLTEHGVYLRERFLALHGAGMSPMARRVFLAFLEGVCRLTYAESHVVAPVSDFNGRWARRLGCPPERAITIHNGVRADAYPEATHEPPVPTVSFVGRIDHLKDLATMIRAFRVAVDAVPNARLRLFGPTPAGNEGYRAELEALVDELELGDAVRFEGPVSSSRIASEAGHVVALSSISEGLPFTVMEAMMCGRATVNTDVGGVAEVVGPDGVAGIVVPPREPEALGQAMATLLSDHEERRRMGRAARERALAMFTLDRFVDRHRRLYDSCFQPDLALLHEPAEVPVAVEPVAVEPVAVEPVAAPAPMPVRPVPAPLPAGALSPAATEADAA